MTFSVSWVPTTNSFAHRFDRYLDFDFFEHQVPLAPPLPFSRHLTNSCCADPLVRGAEFVHDGDLHGGRGGHHPHPHAALRLPAIQQRRRGARTGSLLLRAPVAVL